MARKRGKKPPKNPSSAFPPQVAEDALINSRRSCCLCHVYAGLYVNVHHIVPAAEGGPNTLDNAVVLCLKCHGEVGHYNPMHPIGRKFTHSEVRRLRDAWWEWCKSNPQAPLPADPISVFPSAIQVPAGKWNRTTALAIRNKADVPYYSVCIQLGIGLAGITAEEIKLNKTPVPVLTVPIGKHIMVGDVFGFFATDKAGHEGLYLFLQQIEPQSTKLISLQTKKAGATAEAALLPVTLRSFEATDEGTFIHTANKAAFLFKAPDDLTLNGVVFELH